jgi:tetratricopeptide (TPR) repeat protein
MKILIWIVGLISIFFVLPAEKTSFASELTIDHNLKVELINNKMSTNDAQRVFKYAKSTLYDHEKYKRAIAAFKPVIDHSKSDLRDDSLYFIGKCYYHLRSSKNNGFHQKHIETFRQLFSLFPNGTVVTSGALKETLLNIIEKESLHNFFYLMQSYQLLIKIYPETENEAKQLVYKRSNESIECLTEAASEKTASIDLSHCMWDYFFSSPYKHKYPKQSKKIPQEEFEHAVTDYGSSSPQTLLEAFAKKNMALTPKHLYRIEFSLLDMLNFMKIDIIGRKEYDI